MEDVLELYEEPYDAQRPVVCFDETSKQLIEETRVPLPAQPAEKGHPGQRERYDYEYQRNGTRNLFMHCEPKAGWRHVEVTEQRTMTDFAQQMKWLAEEAYPTAEIIRVVLDNLNTHRPASLYEAFEAAEARRVLRRLEFHYTPLPKGHPWLLAQHGRDRVERFEWAMSGSPDRRGDAVARRSASLASSTQCRSSQDQLALYLPGRTHQIASSLSSNFNLTAY
jgi:DDE superfamily endonuclease